MSSIFLSRVFHIAVVIDLATLAVVIWLMASGHGPDVWLVALAAFFLCTIFIGAYVRHNKPKTADVEGRGGIPMNRLRSYYYRDGSVSSDSSNDSDGIDRSSLRSVEGPYARTPARMLGVTRGGFSDSAATLVNPPGTGARISPGSSRFSSASTLVIPQATHTRSARTQHGHSGAASGTSLPAQPHTPIIRPQMAHTRPATPSFR
ncbi:hypothetical protein D6C95_05048 [Aureobasidium pullulans]|nr:hypothetical protein D6C95_05048 [Aureobasidium pullulans]